MRIRSIKPEFWRSDDVTVLSISTRLTFIGLWSYVDDNGVGADKLVSIVADLYADDFSRDPQETLKRVSEDLERLASGGQVIRFRGFHNGREKELLYITKWKHHQVVNHPSLGHKYPLPPAETVDAAKDLQSVSRDSLETLRHEQGNRGTGEQGKGAVEKEGEPTRPQCSKHKENSEDERCRGCMKTRLWDEQHAAAKEENQLDQRRRLKTAEAEAQRNCLHCDDAGWLKAEDGEVAEPAMKCQIHLEGVS